MARMVRARGRGAQAGARLPRVSPQERIEAYFAACSSGDAAAVAGHFTEHATIYDTNHPPVRGAATIGEFWAKVANRWGGARWVVDRCVAAGNEAAIEWTMTGSSPRPFVVRGSEHYRFATTTNLIEEIRQYWTFRPDQLDTGLVDFPYEG